MKRFLIILSLLLLMISCKNEEIHKKEQNPQKLFSLLDSTQTGINFENSVENKKDFNIFSYRNFYNGGGVAIGDINNDGLPDIYFTSNQNQNKLYLNRGDFKFEDITEKAGVSGAKAWSTGVVMVDLNGDGFLDIYVCNAGNVEGDNQKNELFINNGDLTFTEKAEDYNLAESGFTTHAAFFDYDKDGDLDVYILNNSFIPVNSLQYNNKRELRAKDWNLPKQLLGGGDKLLRNDEGKFIDVSEKSGIYGSLIGFGLGVTVGDVNNDYYPDIYVSNDFYERDYLYINNQDGTFSEEIENWTGHISHSSMGADMADINNDGNPDIFVTDMLAEDDKRAKEVSEFDRPDIYELRQRRGFYNQQMQNTLQLNTGNNAFSEIAYFSGVAKTDWSWSPLIFDMDNDGYRDIYVSNGMNHDLTDGDFMDFFANELIQKMVTTGKKQEIDSVIKEMPRVPILNYAFKNNKDLTFSKKMEDWGFETPSFSNGSAYGDLDNDGDLDLLVNNVNMPAFVYKNNSEKVNPKNHFVKLKLKGTNKNTFGIGSTVDLYTKNGILRNVLIPSRGFQSSVDYTLTIGLGEEKTIDSALVVWPNGKSQSFKNLAVDTTFIFNENSAIKQSIHTSAIKGTTYLSQIKNDLLVKHNENNFSDFDYEGLIPKKMSQEGPSLAIGDVDKDGFEDIYIGGAKDQMGILYLNKGNSKLAPSQQPIFKTDASFEDTAAEFLDIDADDDLDLVVGTGGNELYEAANYAIRFYLNDGNGNFSSTKNSINTNKQNVSVIAPFDFDNDGDLDLFVGMRNIVGTYGINPEHLLLQNDGKGNFTDVTERKAFELKDVGMISDATWVDIDGDGLKDLIIVGDWSHPHVFKNTNRDLRPLKTSLNKMNGWWNTVTAEDLNKDGKMDLILGNDGLNLSYKASIEEPIKLYVNDFDNNGSIEQITTRVINNKDTPIHLKKEITGQLVSLKKQNLKPSDYAAKSLDELFPKEILDNSLIKSVNTTASIVAINQGNGDFAIKELPKEVQFSCVCDISSSDLNGDGNLDLIMAGNNYEFKPQFSRLDANYGSVLLGNGKGDFTWQDYNKSGFFVKGEVKKLAQFKDKSGATYLLVAINNEQPKIFKVNE
ncbi:VCBS repeat-containing protein [Galbibacter sp. BG1]|uniref:VCBS repeat-containing protein n=1 Tax=Galbibacter sp. BG1 TaxID=1170699 RepID=UPI0015BC9EC8|nr:VCBS repeat-containing protein [Galbibacter sp. BG1]QLE00832.1 VCBS repeat-containing protein [Galbibacter sp. BG1]